jgi:hypothetical protein
VSLKRQEIALESLLTKLPTNISIYILVSVQRAQRRGVIYKQRAEQEGVGRAYKAEAKAGTAYCRASSSSTQEESKASSTALGKEGINGIKEGTSSSIKAKEGSSLSPSLDKSGVGSSSRTEMTAGL